MKGMILIRRTVIIMLVMVFSGCAQVSTTTTGTSTALAATRPPTVITNLAGDAIITFANRKLSHVTPVAPKHPGEVFQWTVTPPNNDVRICIVSGNTNPFTDTKWQDGCEDGDNQITGTMDSSLEVGLTIKYSVLDIDNNIIIDPIIIVY